MSQDNSHTLSVVVGCDGCGLFLNRAHTHACVLSTQPADMMSGVLNPCSPPSFKGTSLPPSLPTFSLPHSTSLSLTHQEHESEHG